MVASSVGPGTAEAPDRRTDVASPDGSAPDGTGPGPGGPAEDAASAVLEDVPVVMRAIRARMREGRPPGISVAQFRALLYVRRHAGCGVSDLAEHLGTSVPAASELASRLVRQDLLIREIDPSERRRIRLTLSPVGSGQLEGARRSAMDWLRVRVSALEPDRQRALVAALADLRSLIEPASGSADDDPDGRPTAAT